jgi:hypothetical protein
MPCEKYKKALIELAANGAEPDRGLRTHLDACVSCRGILQQERALFCSIDATLRHNSDAEVPASFLPGLHERLAQEPMRRSTMIPAWTVVTATAGIVIAAVWILHVHSPDASRPQDQNQVTAATRSEPKSLVEHSVAAPNAVAAARSRAIRPARTVRINAVTVHDPEVLVPRDEAEAFARFLSDLNGRHVAEALVKPLTERLEHNDPIQTPKIETAELVVGPLEGPHDE